MPKKKKDSEKTEVQVEEPVEEAEEKLEGKNLEKAAEAESTDAKESESLEEKRKKLLEKAKKLSASLDETKTEELKEQVKGEKKTDMLVPLEEYIRSGIYIGTRVVTPDMREFVYRRRADGLAIFNTDLIDVKIKEGIKYLAEYAPEDVILVCKREAGWRAAKKFSEITGIRVFTKKYPAGILTNPDLPNFFETELTIVSDAWVDKNALNDTKKVNGKVLMICDTNNFSKGSDQIIIGNNKSPKSLGVIYYLLARGYCKARGLESEKDIPDLDWWIGDKGSSEDEAKRKAKVRTKYGI